MGSTFRRPPGPGAERPQRRWWISAVASLMVFGVAATWSTRSRPSPNPLWTSGLRNTGYVDSGACTECHADVVRTYQNTGMARSFHWPNVQTVIEDFKYANRFVHKVSGLTYGMTERDGKFYMRRSAVGSDGKETSVMEPSVRTRC